LGNPDQEHEGNLNVGDPRTWWRDTLDQLAATPLALRAEHVAELYTLPPLHKDPFDRILIAQASLTRASWQKALSSKEATDSMARLK
jgi:PIN domain nuclease of toxin-antitoxin system